GPKVTATRGVPRSLAPRSGPVNVALDLGKRSGTRDGDQTSGLCCCRAADFLRPPGRVASLPQSPSGGITPLTAVFPGADDGIRTRDPHLGKVMLYQLSHVRVSQLSYRPLASASR